ncbi:hypothetical protein UFOVP260_53 [uncultured Caudovirales phage]|uniref:Uncharacterized protein n=1 Tax=uncultured Caudovirales phage TaxID=2100421 RepID=A0A6J5S377_9CAUD|nr:hypothetical protein UFOVP85_9 [uncultured Caudovirales phage]CAB4132686.1 hypothetical protein UFOVP260_53 [uncultured Caudovirales phage]CAB4202979.1 hypothetical protein UFOVP1363_52 [uncultured Caudovirales phage]CAB5207155.1 hypothetical protein UFOVP179_26 [uncultured Caudovirales phage]
MSLLSSIILPRLEKELVAMEPAISQFILSQMKSMASEVIEWAETKIDVDINNDGLIGDDKEERNG